MKIMGSLIKNSVKSVRNVWNEKEKRSELYLPSKTRFTTFLSA